MVGACSTTLVQILEDKAPPPSNLMQPPPPLQTLNKENPTPEEAIEVVLLNYGLYHEISLRLQGLQAYVNEVILQNN